LVDEESWKWHILVALWLEVPYSVGIVCSYPSGGVEVVEDVCVVQVQFRAVLASEK